MPVSVHYDSRCVHVDGEMTVYTCGELKTQLLEQLGANPDATQLDLSRVSEIDTAGLQLLLIARRYASDGGRDLCVANPSHAVTEVLELCRLDARLVPAAAATGAQ